MTAQHVQQGMSDVPKQKTIATLNPAPDENSSKAWVLLHMATLYHTLVLRVHTIRDVSASEQICPGPQNVANSMQ
jgi:hypothetical protein